MNTKGLTNIAILNPISWLGGSEISLLELLSRTKERFQFHLILPAAGPLKRKAEEIGVKVWVVPWPDEIMRLGERNKRLGLFTLISAAKLSGSLTKDIARLLTEINADILISNGIKCHILGAMVRKSYPITLIWYLRDCLEGRPFSHILLSFFSSRCSSAIAISQFIARQARNFLPSSTPIYLIRNIVDLEKFKPGLAPCLDLVKKEPEVWFGTVGTITPIKGQDLFLEAAKIVVKSIPSSRFIITGADTYKTKVSINYEKRLRLLANSPVLRDRVNFLGAREDIPDILACLDVLVQPNRGPEGLGRSIIEAMACAKPVIAVNRWGPAELIQDYQTGILFPRADVKILSDKMILLAKDKELRKRLGDNARSWVYKNLVPEKIANEFIDILENAVAGSLSGKHRIN